jgi:hypothetical protein
MLLLGTMSSSSAMVIKPQQLAATARSQRRLLFYSYYYYTTFTTVLASSRVSSFRVYVMLAHKYVIRNKDHSRKLDVIRRARNDV